MALPCASVAQASNAKPYAYESGKRAFARIFSGWAGRRRWNTESGTGITAASSNWRRGRLFPLLFTMAETRRGWRPVWRRFSGIRTMRSWRCWWPAGVSSTSRPPILPHIGGARRAHCAFGGGERRVCGSQQPAAEQALRELLVFLESEVAVAKAAG